jgi:hypothetical protein
MKTKTTTLLLLLAFVMNSGFRGKPGNDMVPAGPADKEGNAPFTLARSDDDISIYIRWIPVNETRSARQLKAEFVMDCPAEHIISALRDEKTYTQWMKATKEYYRIKTISADQWYSYVQFSIPWPLNNQDCILKYEVRDLRESGKTEITLVSEPDLLRANEGIERISHMSGSWVITRLGNTKTHIAYYIFSKQAPRYPAWITDPLIQRNLLRTMSSFRDFVLSNSSIRETQ